jgi:transposase InsO family protein
LEGVKAAAERFRAKCRELGLTAGDYPLNQTDKAVRSLGRTLRGWLTDNPRLAAEAADARVKPSSALRRLPERAALRAFDTVEFDAHKMDLRLKVVDVDPVGGEQAMEIERVWLLAIIDVATRCILGWTLSLARECSRIDVVQTVQHALVPQEPPTVTLPGLRLKDGGGFVSQRFEAARFACWRQMRLDNARANLATTSLDVLCETLGCTADFGPAYEPDDRPFIERYFGTVVQTLSHRLPGAVRSPRHPQAALARLRARDDSLRLLVTVDELEEILAVAIWNYHATPHSGQGGATPMEVMGRHLQAMADPEHGELAAMHRLPPLLRDHPALLHDPVQCLVRGNPAHGLRPYITFMHVRYSSEQLARSGRLLGQKLRVHVDPDDLRTLVAVTADGELLQPLLAASGWRHERHSLWLRREFFKAKRARTLALDAADDPIEAFVKQRRAAARKKSGAKASKRAASDLARAQHDRRRNRAADDSAPAAGPAEPTSVLSQLASEPATASKLHIEPGLNA